MINEIFKALHSFKSVSHVGEVLPSSILRPDIDVAVKLAAALGVSVAELLEDESPVPAQNPGVEG